MPPQSPSASALCILCKGLQATPVTPRIFGFLGSILKVDENHFTSAELCQACLNRVNHIGEMMEGVHNTFFKREIEPQVYVSDEHSYSSLAGEIEVENEIPGCSAETQEASHDQTASVILETFTDESDTQVTAIEFPTPEIGSTFKVSGKVLEMPCPICDCSYISTNNLNQHMETYHWKTKGDMYSCVRCQALFPEQVEVLRHARSHREDLQKCETCSAVFPTWQVLHEHEANGGCQKDGMVAYSCDECYDVSKTKSEISFHKLVNHGMWTKIALAEVKVKFPCPFCNVSLTTILALWTHLPEHGVAGEDFMGRFYGENPIESEPEMVVTTDKTQNIEPLSEKCFTQVKRTSRSILKRGVKRKIIQEKFIKMAPRPKSLRQVLEGPEFGAAVEKAEEDQYECGCGQFFPSVILRKKHRVEVHKGRFVCSYPGCDEECVSSHGIKRHYFTQHAANVDLNQGECREAETTASAESNPALEDGEVPLSGIEEEEVETKTKHDQSREKRGIYKCVINICQANFANVEELKRHFALKHPPRPRKSKIEPQDSEKTRTHPMSKKVKDQVAHGRRGRRNRAQYECGCGKCFSSKLFYEIHRNKEHGGKYVCNQAGCEEQTATAAAMRLHSNSHGKTSSLTKPKTHEKLRAILNGDADDNKELLGLDETTPGEADGDNKYEAYVPLDDSDADETFEPKATKPKWAKGHRIKKSSNGNTRVKKSSNENNRVEKSSNENIRVKKSSNENTSDKAESFECGCGSAFDSREEYKTHRDKKHGGMFICSYEGCNAFFTKEYSVKRHSYRMHQFNNSGKGKNVRTECGCGETFLNPLAYREHVKAVHDGMHLCRVKGCNQRFSRLLNEERHYFSHFPGSFKCEECGRNCKTPSQKENHIRQAHSQTRLLSSILLAMMPGVTLTESDVINAPVQVEAIVHGDGDTANTENPGTVIGSNENSAISQLSTTVEAVCFICDATYQHEHHFQNHMETNHWIIDNEGFMKCVKCGTKSKDVLQMVPHAREHRNKMERCTKCDLVFPNWGQAADHLSKEHVEGMTSPSYNCLICDENLDTRSLLSYHRLLTHGLTTRMKIIRAKHKFTCSHCEASFSKAYLLTAHLKRHQKAIKRDLPEGFETTCSKCYQEFPDIETRAQHTLGCKGPEIKDAGDDMVEFPCCVCDATHTNLCWAQKHLMTSHWTYEEELGYYKCVQCETMCMDLAAMADHARTHRSDLMPCRRCTGISMVFQSESQLLVHIENAHKLKTDTIKTSYQCTTCDETASTKSLISLHHLLNHGSFIEIKKEASAHICPICNRSFVTYPYLRMHLKRHKAKGGPLGHKRIHKCSNCQKVFSLKLMLDEHVESRVCEESGRVFKTPSDNDNRSSQLRYLCDLCGQAFKSKMTHADHMAEHSGEAKYECKICHLRFMAPGKLRRHLVTHTRPHVCDVCGKTFSVLSHLKSHKVTHTTKRDWECEVCNQSFQWRLSLIAHLWSKHRIGNEPKRSGQESIMCILCNTKMLRRSLRKHFRQKHPDVPFNVKSQQFIPVPENMEGENDNEHVIYINTSSDPVQGNSGDVQSIVLHLPPEHFHQGMSGEQLMAVNNIVIEEGKHVIITGGEQDGQHVIIAGAEDLGNYVTVASTDDADQCTQVPNDVAGEIYLEA